MSTFEQQFHQIAQACIATSEHVQLGKMMSHPGIQYKGKNFAFFGNDEMVFKLGKDYDIEQTGVSQWSHLSPFKTKPPLTAWYVIGAADAAHWDALAKEALQIISK